ncbi:RCC1 domain-containing protein [Wohlfahrtiimonas larvae]|uniref:Chromosome condensation regulator RCC1 n=1 Tax=Wohlfahrtiimonas larvae TaxID=1157986 RepID=A0ABP9MRX4_9GAMM|nr:hypothetical protein [Wohlfahrtiimonas larvae]
MQRKVLRYSLLCVSLLPLLVNMGITQTLEASDSGYGINGGEGAAQSTTAIDTGVGIKNGEVWIWGYKGSGQQGNGSTNGNLYDRDRVPEKIASLQNIVSVSGGAYHLLAVDYEGYVFGWGLNARGETGCGHTGIVSIPCEVKGTDGQRLRVRQAVGAGEYNSIYLDLNGNVLTSGSSAFGQLGLGPKAKNTATPTKIDLNGEVARLIGAAYEGGFAVTYDKNSWDTNEQNVWAWGRDFYSSLGLYASGDNYVRSPMKVENLKPYANKIVKIAGGYQYGVALLNDGKVIGWGWYRSVGQSCNSSRVNTTKSPIPVEVPFPPKMVNGVLVPSKVVQMESYFTSTIVLTNHNEIYTFGTSVESAYDNIQGTCPKLANITDEFRNEHSTLDSEGNRIPGSIVKIGRGKHHITYEMSDGTAWGVGYNAGGQIFYGAGLIRDFPGQQLRDLQ